MQTVENNTNSTTNFNGNGAAHHPSALAGLSPDVNANSSIAAEHTNPEAAPEVGGAHRAADRLTRNRDKYNNRLPWFYSHSVPVTDDMPLSETGMGGAIEHIKAALPIVGHELEHFHERILRPAVRRLLAVQDAEYAAMEAHNTAAVANNAALDAEESNVNLADQNRIAQIEELLVQKHEIAADRVAKANRVYDPATPSAEAVLAHREHSQKAVAAELRLPWTPADSHSNMPKVVSWLVTIVVGVMIGLSLGLISTFVPMGDWAARPLPLAVFLSVGISAAIGGKFAIRHAARVASQRYWIGRSTGNWAFFALVSIFVTVGIIAIDSHVEREGLMASVKMQSLAQGFSGTANSGAAPDSGLYLLMAVILTFGYAINAYFEGYLCGRLDACLNRIQEIIELRSREEDAAHRSRQETTEALLAVAEVRGLLHEKALLEQRISVRRAELDLKRKLVWEDLSDEAQRRIQDARDELNGTQETWNAMFRAAKLRVEGDGTIAGGLGRLLGSGGRARKVHKEQKRRIRK